MSTFTFSRVAQLIRLDLVANKSAIYIAAATIAALLFLFNLVSPDNIYTVSREPTLYYLILFLGGIGITHVAFKDLHDKKRTYLFLTVPASTLEKFLCRWFLTSFGFVAATLLLYTFIYWIIGLFVAIIYHQELVLFNPLRHNSHILFYSSCYFFWHSLFFLGAIYFKKNQFLKTVFSFCMSLIALTILVFILTAFLCHPIFFMGVFWRHFGVYNLYHWSFLFFTAVTIMFWLTSYQRLKEHEDI
jgi:hypothetical protein